MIQISQKHLCCGCTACKSICPKNCITMEPDFEGFLYPTVNTDPCTDCGLCEKVCPVLHRPKLGSSPSAVAMRSKDKGILGNSTSGGCFTPLAKYTLSKGGIVFGAVYGEDFRVVHQAAETQESITGFRGSKYVQSDMSDIFTQVRDALDSGRQVLFSGTPCQVSGLKNFLLKDYENLYCIDIICHGVPSPKLWDMYRDAMQSRYSSRFVHVNFRQKTYGYHSGTMAIQFENGSKYTGSARVDWMLKCFFSEISSRPSCFHCTFKTMEHASDLSLFDCWHASTLVKKLRDDDKGYTSVLIHTKKGEELLKNIKDDVNCYHVDAERAVELDGSMVCRSAKPHPQREQFYEFLSANNLPQTVQKFIPISTADKLAEGFKGCLYTIGLLKVIKALKK